MPSGVSICILFYLVSLTGGVQSQTYLRTGVVELSRWDRALLAERSSDTHAKQIGMKDERWGPFFDKQTYILQIPQDLGHQAASLLLKTLQASSAIVGDYLPHDTYLLIADHNTIASNLLKDCTVAPYLPTYKIAPEWNPVLDVVTSQYETQRVASANHWDLHAQVVSHPEIHKQLRLLQPSHKKQQQHRQLLQQHHAQSHGFPSRLSQDGGDVQLPPQLLIGVDFPFVHPEDLGSTQDHQQLQPAQAAAADWSNHLEQLAARNAGNHSLGYAEYCTPQVHVSSRSTLTVSVCPKDLKAVLEWLSHQPPVYWLYPKPQMRLQNLNAGAITQGAVPGQSFDTSQPEAHPLWSKGLDGKGQLVGVGDSGIDMDSCYFFDPEVPFSAAGRMFSSKTHRKVAAYSGLADPDMLDRVGHGTHVVGSIIGEKIGSRADPATGVAPGARVAFLDLSSQADGADVNTPDNLMDNYFMLSYNMGVRVHSDSWGGWGAIYDTSSYYTDMMTWRNQDFVSVLAAGNYGTSQKYSSTVTSPATAKNCITVGATLNYDPGYVSTPAVKIWVMELMIKRVGLPDQLVIRRLVQADFGGTMDALAKAGASTPVTLADPPAACASISKSAAGSVLLVKRGDCFFANKLKAAADAGAVGVVVVNDRAGGYFKMEAQEGEAITTSIPMLGISQRLGDGLWTLISFATSGSAAFYPAGTGQPSYDDIASFSSFGPTQDLRTKPDVVAPGALVSAASDKQLTGISDTCLTTTKRGTSMATPIVAGTALLIRQYFADGFYPTGRAVEANGFAPSGPLIKAVLLGGAIDMAGNTVEGLPLDPMGSRQGYGRVNLTNSLKFVGGGQNIQVVDLAVIQQGEKHSYCLRGIGGPVAVTLTWYDYPASPPSDPSVPLLINDLDLSMRAAGLNNALLLGNGAADRLNTVEKITVADLPPGAITIEVTAVKISVKTASQKYALVVQGAFSGVLASANNPDAMAKTATAGACASMATVIAKTASANATAIVAAAAAEGSDTADSAAAEMAVAAPDSVGNSSAVPAEQTPAAAQAASVADPGSQSTQQPAAGGETVPAPAPIPEAAAAATDASAAAAVDALSGAAPLPGLAAAAGPTAAAAAPINPTASKDALLTALIASMVPTQGRRRLAAVMEPLKHLSISPSTVSAAWCYVTGVTSSTWSHQPSMAAAGTAAAPGGSDDQSSLRSCHGVSAGAGVVVIGGSVLFVLLAAFAVRKVYAPNQTPRSPPAVAAADHASSSSSYQPLSTGPEEAAPVGKVAAAMYASVGCPVRSPSPTPLARRVLQQLLFPDASAANSFLTRCKSSSSSALERGLSQGSSGNLRESLQPLLVGNFGPLPHAHSDSELEVHPVSQLPEECVQGFTHETAELVNGTIFNTWAATENPNRLHQQQQQQRVLLKFIRHGSLGDIGDHHLQQQQQQGVGHLPPRNCQTFSSQPSTRRTSHPPCGVPTAACCPASGSGASGGSSSSSSQWSGFLFSQQQSPQQQHLLPVASASSSPTKLMTHGLALSASHDHNTQQQRQQQHGGPGPITSSRRSSSMSVL